MTLTSRNPRYSQYFFNDAAKHQSALKWATRSSLVEQSQFYLQIVCLIACHFFKATIKVVSKQYQAVCRMNARLT